MGYESSYLLVEHEWWKSKLEEVWKGVKQMMSLILCT